MEGVHRLQEHHGGHVPDFGLTLRADIHSRSGLDWRGRVIITDTVFPGPGMICEKRRASVRDFHSLRVTWITLALAAGVPLELVQRVTGHRTAEVVMKHYFRPGREDFRAAIFKAMPKMLGEGATKSAIEEARGILQAMTARTWRGDRARALDLLANL